MKKNTLVKIFTVMGCLALLVCHGGTAIGAGDNTDSDGLPVPRFVSLGSDEVNVRTGPGLRYPIRWVFHRQGMPVEIVREFDVWRQIKDMDGDEGWVHESLLSGKRTVVVTGKIRTMYEDATTHSRPVVRLQSGVVARLDHCEQGWCNLKAAGYEGWLKRDQVWGLLPGDKGKQE